MCYITINYFRKEKKLTQNNQKQPSVLVGYGGINKPRDKEQKGKYLPLYVHTTSPELCLLLGGIQH